MKIKKTVIFVGYECNNHCTFCLNSEKRKYIRHKKTAEIFNDILEAKKNSTTYLEFIGGEITIRKDFFDIISFAKKIGFETIMIATNGRMFSKKEFAKKALESGLNHIVFSIHGHNEALHDKLTEAPGSFKQLLLGIKNLQDLNFNEIGSNSTIVKENYKYIPDIGRLITSIGIENSEFIFVDPNQGAPDEFFFDMVPTYEEVSPYVNELLRYGYEKKLTHWMVRYYPLCFIEEKYHPMVSEIMEVENFKTEHIAVDFINKDVSKGRENVGKQKIGKCKNCDYSNKCEGYWRNYVKKRPYVNKFEFDEISEKEKNYIKNNIELLKKDEDFLDKIYFLLGLKKVLRITVKEKKELISKVKFLDKYESIYYNDKYVFFSKDKNLAKIARDITHIFETDEKVNEIASKEYNNILGNLYGYPSCCSSAFNSDEIMKYVKINKGKELRRNKKIIHYPCSFDCKNTVELENEFLKRLEYIGIKI